MDVCVEGSRCFCQLKALRSLDCFINKARASGRQKPDSGTPQTLFGKSKALCTKCIPETAVRLLSTARCTILASPGSDRAVVAAVVGWVERVGATVALLQCNM